ncbi:hypothetical protein RRG08_040000 [Elysia crispata]|uniref:Uncharacterized protein n=1 Tax=Elysia crispata TaxID=231223 RepID=A0AAE0Z7Q3_9GAST|nr:hypothetical protein RRG08_040000 [Elysia crispata]
MRPVQYQPLVRGGLDHTEPGGLDQTRLPGSTRLTDWRSCTHMHARGESALDSRPATRRKLTSHICHQSELYT